MNKDKKSSVTFKGNKDGLLVLCDEKASWDEILDTLKECLQGKKGNFFEGARVMVDLGTRTLKSEQAQALWYIMEKNGLQIKSIKTGTDSNKREISRREGREIDVDTENGDATNQLPTLLIKRSMRSGQNITFDGNIIIFGDVNPGAEIKATGFILIMGDLRGTVHAGATGDEKAWVAALHLQPTQLRLAGLIATAPQEEPMLPELAQISEGMIVVKQLKKSTNHIDFNRGD